MTHLELPWGTVEVDDRMASIVTELNRLPGISTFSSCGGHENPTGSQVPAGTFSVSLDVEATQSGWHSLEVLTWATMGWSGDVRLSTWYNGEEEPQDGSGLCFSLDGSNGAVPDDLAEVISDWRTDNA